METIYTYSLSGDFGGNITPHELRKEIQNDLGVDPTCNKININDGDVDIHFSAELSVAEQTTLNGLVTAHMAPIDPSFVLVTGGALNTTMTLTTSQTANRTLTLPDDTDTIACVNCVQTLTNKDMTSDTNTFALDTADVTTGTFADALIAESNVIQHEGSITHQNISGSGTNTHAQIDSHITDATLHRIINDGGTSATELWSASKISGDLAGKSGTEHTHDWDAATGTADEIPFNSAYTTPSHSEGILFYDKDEHTMAVYNDESAVTHQLGQEGYIRVYNNSGASITDGKPVYVTGTDGTEGRPTIAMAKADALTTSSAIGVTTHSIENNTFGYITSWGVVNGLDTSSFTAGDTVYLSHTTAGAITTIEPPDGNYRLQVGFVTKVDAASGKLLVTISPQLNGVSDSNKVIMRAIKGSVGTINPAEVVYISGYNITEDCIEIELADSSNAGTMPSSGVSRDSITNASIGYVVLYGNLINIDTSSFNQGDDVYVSETPGALTTTKPTGTALVQKIGIISRSHATAGVLEIIGAGRSNDLPNLANNKFWFGNSSGVPVETTALSGFNLDLGTSSGTVSEGNHTHVVANITDFATEFNSSFDTRLGVKDTADLTEGSNLYYTDARVSTWIDTQKGANNGLASLDGGGKVPASQLALNNVVYMGSWNADTNTPTLVSSTGTQGNYYVVSFAGTTNIDGFTDWQVGDWIIFNGTIWEQADHTDAVTSVAGKQGVVTLQIADITDLATTADLPENTNLYYTEARVSANSDVVANVEHASSTSNPHSVTKAQVGLTNVLDILHKIDATVAPAATNDTGSGYSAGSTWTDVTSDKSYICLDATASSAVWRRTDIVAHDDLSGIGSNSHSQIDTHISDDTLHFTEGSIDHGSIAGLYDDDHTQYLLLGGRSGGQYMIGGSAASETLTLESSSNATKGTIDLKDPTRVDDVDALTATTLLLGKATATKVEIADTGIITEIQGNLDALEGLDVTGDITVTGTVDGRDVAGDGSTLDSHTGNSAIHEIITASNKAGDQGVFSEKVGTDLQFKSLTQGTNITMTADANTITINSSVGLNWLGAWVTSTSYLVNQVVTNDGSSYICISNHTSAESDEPGFGNSWATYWDLMSSKGDVGPSVTNSEITDTVATSTTSGTYVVLNSMTTTPASGTYMVSFSSSGRGSGNRASNEYCIHKAGVIVQHTHRILNEKASVSNDFTCAMHSQAIITVNGSETIEVRYKTDIGTFTVLERSMILLKVA